jgi:hypothetical protein
MNNVRLFAKGKRQEVGTALQELDDAQSKLLRLTLCVSCIKSILPGQLVQAAAGGLCKGNPALAAVAVGGYRKGNPQVDAFILSAATRRQSVGPQLKWQLTTRRQSMHVLTYQLLTVNSPSVKTLVQIAPITCSTKAGGAQSEA